MRIYEQEMFIIRLTIAIHEGRETIKNEKVFREEVEKLEEEYKEKEIVINKLGFIYNDLKQII